MFALQPPTPFSLTLPQPKFFYLTHPGGWYVASSNTFFVAPKGVSVCITADTALSNTNFVINTANDSIIDSDLSPSQLSAFSSPVPADL